MPHFDALNLRLHLIRAVQDLHNDDTDLRDYYDVKGATGRYDGQTVEDISSALHVAIAALEDCISIAVRM